MSPLQSIFLEHIRFWVRRPVYWLFLLGSFFAAWGLLVGTAGLFDPSASLIPARPWLNAPVSIYRMGVFFHPFLLATTAIIAGQTGARDYLYRTHPLIFSTPVSKYAYLLGRWLASVILLLGISVMLLAGLWLAEHTPGTAPHQLGPTRPLAYLYAWTLFMFPNIITWSALIFTGSLHTRNTYTAYMLAITLWLIRFLLPAFSAEAPLLPVLGDPFGEYAQEYLIRYWTVEEQQTELLPYSPLLFWNRLLYLGLATGVFALGAYRFRFANALTFGRGERILERLSSLPFPAYYLSSIRVPSVWWLGMFHVRYLVRQPIVFLISGLALLSFILVGHRVLQGTQLTFQVDAHLLLAAPAALYSQILLLLTFLISGMLVHRDRRNRMHDLTQLSILPGWKTLVAQMGATWLIQAVLLAMLVMTIAGWQLSYAEQTPEFSLLCIYAYLVIWPWLIIWSLAALAIHRLTGQLYTGLLILLLAWIGISVLPEVGLDETLWLFPGSAQLELSRFQHLSGQLLPFFYVKGYWLSLSVFCLLIASLLRNRGGGGGLAERWAFAKNRTRPVMIFFLLILASLWLTWGHAIYCQEKGGYHPPDRAARTAYLQSIHPFMDQPFPLIRDINLTLDLYPEAQAYSINGIYRLENPHNRPLDTLLLRGGFDERTSFSWDVAARRIYRDSLFQTEVWVLDQPLMPASSIELYFTIHSQPATLFDHPPNVNSESIYLQQDVLPRLGYPILDSLPADLRRNYLSADADLVHLTTTICAPKHLQLIAPGTPTQAIQRGDRHCMTFQLPKPTKFSFGFLAGRYVRTTDYWDALPLHVWHHPDHGAVVPLMTTGLCAALQYHTRYFPAYPFADASIVEFPGTLGSHATAYANLLPVSERNFLIRPDTTQASVFLPFYIVAHELTHQWWGNQVIPADGPGALMLTESITEYLSGQIYRQQFGHAALATFMRVQHERYFRGRTADTGRESPLSQVEDSQSYLAYGKGALVFHALAKRVGEERLNHLLAVFLRKHTPPVYPKADDLVQLLTDSLPLAHAPFLHDRFRTVTLHHLRWKDVRVQRRPTGTWQITLSIEARAERMIDGTWQAIPFAEDIRIDCYDKQGNVLAQLTISPEKMNEASTLVLSQEPSHLTLDPHLNFLDPDLSDQVIYLREQ